MRWQHHPLVPEALLGVHRRLQLANWFKPWRIKVHKRLEAWLDRMLGI